jgi:ABC-2 type transport system ATP-binding protein
MIQVKELVKTYADLTAVDHITFSVEKGDIVGLLGPNGAGKTTTMKILTCFMPATSGMAKVAGHDVFKESLEVRRHIGYMPENVPLYPEMRVNEFLSYRGQLKGLKGQYLINRMSAVIDACELGQVRTRIIDQLSKGNKQRVGLADALIGDPDLLVLDEPTIGLDPNQVRKVRELIKEIGRDRTVILSTHILPEVEMVCEKVIIMYKGKVVAQDSMSNLRSGNKKRYCVEVKGPKAEVERALLDVKEAYEIRTSEEEGWVRAEMLSRLPEENISEKIFLALQKHSWPMRLLTTKMPTLEDIFVEMTTKH